MINQQEILCGFHAVIAALQFNSVSIEKIYIDKTRFDNRMKNLIQLITQITPKIQIYYTDSQHLKNITAKKNTQGVVAFVKFQKKTKPLTELIKNCNKPSLILILDGITDPHNLGACLRVAAAAAVDIVILPKKKSSPINMTVKKVASGAAEIVPIITVTNLARTMKELKDTGICLIGTDDRSNISLYDCGTELKNSIALIMGSEDKGMRCLTGKICDIVISIPMFGNINSLNVSVATGICLYEIQRQRFGK